MLISFQKHARPFTPIPYIFIVEGSDLSPISLNLNNEPGDVEVNEMQFPTV